MEKLSLDLAFYCCNLMLDDSKNQFGHIYETDDHFSDIRPEIMERITNIKHVATRLW